MKKRLIENDTEIKTLNNDLSDLKDNNLNMQLAIHNQLEKIDNLEFEINKLQSKNKYLNQELEENSTKISNLSNHKNKDIELKDEEARDLRNKLKQMESKCDSYSSEINMLNKKLNQTKNE